MSRVFLRGTFASLVVQERRLGIGDVVLSRYRQGVK